MISSKNKQFNKKDLSSTIATDSSGFAMDNNSGNITNRKLGRLSRRSGAGFTLIEMIVAVSIFVIVVFVAIGALLSISDANRKSNAIRAVMDNLNFSMESMGRKIRTGDSYSCSNIGMGSGNCISGGTQIDFIDQYGTSIAYRYDSVGKGIMIRKNGGSFTNITAPTVKIGNLKFYVTGVGPDNRQPKVVISIKGVAGISEKEQTSFTIQTSISQRSVEF